MLPIAHLFQTGERSDTGRALAGRKLAWEGMAQILPQRGGAHTLTLLNEWIGTPRAAEILGVSESSICRICDRRGRDGEPLLVSRRPTPKKRQVSLASLLALKARIEADPDFWEKQRVKG